MTVFAADKRQRPVLLSTNISSDSTIRTLSPEQVFADSSQAIINKKPVLKPNALAHVSFFSGVALVLFYLFPFYVPVLSHCLPFYCQLLQLWLERSPSGKWPKGTRVGGLLPFLEWLLAPWLCCLLYSACSIFNGLQVDAVIHFSAPPQDFPLKPVTQSH